MNKRGLTSILTLAIALPAYTIAVLMYSASSDGEVLYKSQQPQTINYQSFDPYTLSIEEGSTKWLTVGWPKSKIIHITRAADGSYGHTIDLDILGVDFSKTDTAWTKDGIELRFDSQHLLTIPKRAFVGGR